MHFISVKLHGSVFKIRVHPFTKFLNCVVLTTNFEKLKWYSLSIIKSSRKRGKWTVWTGNERGATTFPSIAQASVTAKLTVFIANIQLINSLSFNSLNNQTTLRLYGRALPAAAASSSQRLLMSIFYWTPIKHIVNSHVSPQPNSWSKTIHKTQTTTSVVTSFVFSFNLERERCIRLKNK